MRVPRRLEQGHSLFQSWFGDDLSILFLMCGLANARMLLQKWGQVQAPRFRRFRPDVDMLVKGSEPIPAFAQR